MRLSRSRIWLNVQKDRRFPLRLELDSSGFTAADASAHRAGGKHLRPIERRVSNARRGAHILRAGGSEAVRGQFVVNGKTKRQRNLACGLGSRGPVR